MHKQQTHHMVGLLFMRNAKMQVSATMINIRPR
jgi:hypothetical protein